MEVAVEAPSHETTILCCHTSLPFRVDFLRTDQFLRVGNMHSPTPFITTTSEQELHLGEKEDTH